MVFPILPVSYSHYQLHSPYQFLHLFLGQHAPQTHVYCSFLLLGQSYLQIGVLRFVAVGKLYAQGVVVQVVVDMEDVARYHSNRPFSHLYLLSS